MEGLPGWGISSMPGPPLRQHEHGRWYTAFTHSMIITRRIWEDDYDGQIILGDLVCLKFPDKLSYRWGKPRKKPHPGNLSRPVIEPGSAVWQTRMLPPTSQRWTNEQINVEQLWNEICPRGKLEKSRQKYPTQTPFSTPLNPIWIDRDAN